MIRDAHTAYDKIGVGTSLRITEPTVEESSPSPLAEDDELIIAFTTAPAITAMVLTVLDGKADIQLADTSVWRMTRYMDGDEPVGLRPPRGVHFQDWVIREKISN